MSDRSIVIIGLPESGKTTFLAALWHLVTEEDVEAMALRFHTLVRGNASHLNQIAARWRDARIQERTGIGGNRLVSMNLLDAADNPVRVTFPDVPGEAYRRMWEDRDCEPEIAEILNAGGVLLFVHSDTIELPSWLVDELVQAKKLGIPLPAGGEMQWHPRLAPTQVQLVDLLQTLRQPPLDIGPRRLVIMLSAWDKAEGERLAPVAFLDAKLPLLAQYLRQNMDGWTWRVCGLSAQGGEYDPAESNKNSVPEAEKLREMDRPSQRIRLVAESGESHDLTEPLAWLMR